MTTPAARSPAANTPAGVAQLEFGEPVLTAALRAGMRAVEDGLREAVRAEAPIVREPARHLLEAGGKRIRPLVVLLAAQFGDASAAGVVPSAVVVELTHLATLYHDDVMDEAVVRRGAPSANSRWTNTVAILTGDFLFARASDILADLGPAAVRLQARTFETLVTGQIRETVGPAPGVEALEHYLRVLEEKTASLIATAARFGGMAAGVDASTVDLLARYGSIVGMAFQLSDDLLDVTSDVGESGKTPGTDLREGVRTMPVLYALRSTEPAQERLRTLLAGPLDDDDRHAEALALLRASPAVAEASKTLASYAARAREVLGSLPAGPPRDALAAVADYVVARTG
ncbi:MAG: polyprenyl synthetase family protein [Mycobacteriales bacterium]